MRGRAQTGQRYWIGLLLLATTLLVSFETILLGLGTGYFSGGFQSVYADGPVAILSYAVGAILFDLVLVVTSWILCLPLLSHYRGGPLRCASMALLIGVVPAALNGIVVYQIHVVLGRLASTSLLNTGSAGSSTSSAAVLGEFIPPAHITILVICGIFAAALPFVGRRLDLLRQTSWVDPPSVRTLLVIGVSGLALSSSLLAYSIHHDATLYFGLAKKSSGQLLESTIRVLSDWDQDGFGSLSRPIDFAPLDAALHPYAIDISGNGVDENGLGGDRPVGTAPRVFTLPVSPRGTKNPHLLLIFLETFRADLLDAEVEGQPVTPFLTELTREGARSDQMFVHSPWTLAARDQLFQGSITAEPGARTLVDDFLERGYAVAHFSGQDDSYGESAERLGFHRADTFYDARDDVHERTTRSTASVSLQISWQTLLKRVGAYLDAYESDKPLFLYVNIVDTHFPYTHSEIEEIISTPHLPRSQIRSQYSDEVFRAYANTAANVDRAIELLVSQWRETFPDDPRALLVTGDHGESFYESGTLGHGQTIRSIETRVPLIVQGIGGIWPEPMAISDVRGLVASNLGVDTQGRSPRFTPDPDRAVFQYLGKLEAAERVALRRHDGTDVLDILTGHAWSLDVDENPIEPHPSPEVLNRLIWMWEGYQAAQ